MSGILGQILGGVMGGGQEGQPSGFSRVIHQVLVTGDGNTGGLAGLVSRFQAAGLEQQAQSWVGSGPNQPISGDQVGQVFSAEQIQEWATQAGTTPAALQEVLAQAIPHVVDHLTPGGQMPTQTPDVAGVLNRLFGGEAPPRPA